MLNIVNQFNTHINYPEYYQGRIVVIPPKGDYIALKTVPCENDKIGVTLVRYDSNTKLIKGAVFIGRMVASNFI